MCCLKFHSNVPNVPTFHDFLFLLQLEALPPLPSPPLRKHHCHSCSIQQAYVAAENNTGSPACCAGD